MNLIIDKWIDSLGAKATQKQYKHAVLEFFRVIERKPTEKYLNRNVKKYEQEIIQYIKYLKEKEGRTGGKLCPKTIRHDVCAVMQFLSDNGIDLSFSAWKRIRKRHLTVAKAVVDDIPPTKEEMKIILANADVKTKAIALVILSSGARPIEAINLKMKDIDLESKPGRIYINNSKTHTVRTSFISSEAVEQVKVWLKVREQWLKQHERDHGPFKSRTRNNLFCCCYNSVRISWDRLLEKSEFNQKCPHTNYYKRRLYTLRKYFYSNIVGLIGVEAADYLMDHRSELNRTYNKHKISDFIDVYLKGEQALYIFKEVVYDKEMVDNIENQGKYIEFLQKDMIKQKEEIQALKNELKWVGEAIEQKILVPLSPISEKETLTAMADFYNKVLNHSNPDSPVLKGVVHFLKEISTGPKDEA